MTTTTITQQVDVLLDDEIMAMVDSLPSNIAQRFKTYQALKEELDT